MEKLLGTSVELASEPETEPNPVFGLETERHPRVGGRGPQFRSGRLLRTLNLSFASPTWRRPGERWHHPVSRATPNRRQASPAPRDRADRPSPLSAIVDVVA
jgi:hypothetical protein